MPSDHQCAADQVVRADNLVRLKDFIDVEMADRLVAWAMNMRPHLTKNGPSRTFSKVQRLPRVPPLFRKVRFRLQQCLGLPDDIQPEPMFGWYLSVISEGGAVHTHLDAAPEGMRHLRCNLFVQLPETGGYPIIEETVTPVDERMILAFFPNERRHSCEAVEGERSRIICSFGYLVDKAYALPSAEALTQALSSPWPEAPPPPGGPRPDRAPPRLEA